MNPKISIIVPVYNTENYLRECLDSLVNQILKEIEIIVVNDASTDKSKEIIVLYQEKYKNIYLIDKEKSEGPHIARLDGFSISKGEYIGFVDSDDFISRNTFEVAYSYAMNNRADIVGFSGECVYEKGSKINKKMENYITRMDKIFCSGLEYLNNDFIGSLGLNIIGRDIFVSSLKWIPRYKIDMNEDAMSIFILSCQSKKVACLSNKFYFYRQRETSTMGSKISFFKFIKDLKSRFNIILTLYRFIKANKHKKAIIPWLRFSLSMIFHLFFKFFKDLYR